MVLALGHVVFEMINNNNNDLKEEVKIERQNDVVITREKVEKVVNKMPNWKSPGPDLV